MCVYTCTMDKDTIQLGEAIKQMRLLTLKGTPFTFSFCSYNASKGTSQGHIKVATASYRSKATTDSELLEYYDISEQMNKHCYISLLMTFEGKKINI